MGKTIDISTRCGNDSDCNPSNAAGILGTALGYSNIPEKWLGNVKEVEDVTFPYTSLSLNDVYSLSYKHALENLRRNGGKVKGDKVIIACQKPEPVKFEQSFEGVKPVQKERLNNKLTAAPFKYKFEGTGIVVSAQFPGRRQSTSDYVANVLVRIDGTDMEVVKFPADFMVP